jgi:hypothetical protein
MAVIVSLQRVAEQSIWGWQIELDEKLRWLVKGVRVGGRIKV